MKRVFASLANGTVCIFSRKSISTSPPTDIGHAHLTPEACVLKCEAREYKSEAEDWDQPLVLTLSDSSPANSIKCMTFVGKDSLWCGCGNSISVIDLVNMEVVKSAQIFARRTLINELVSNGKKVWAIGRQLSSVMELDVETCEVKRVFDCSRVDPTGSNLSADPSIVEELALPSKTMSEDDVSPSASPQTVEQEEQIPDSSTSSHSSGGAVSQHQGFEISNEPKNPSKTPNAIYNQRLTRKTFTSIKKPRTRAYNISHTEGRSIFAPRPEFDALKRAQIRSLLRQQGATRVTSLLIVEDTLWIARGMGDVLIVNISRDANQHGMALSRLATEDSNKYGNRSNHKLCLVGKDYVVSSQWLEPLDMTRPRGFTDVGLGGSFATEYEVTAHQQITVWEAWNYDRIMLYLKKVSEMLDMDTDATNNID